MFLLALAIGAIFGGIYAYFLYKEQGRNPAIRAFFGWMLAFAVAGLIATPVASWLFQHVL